MSPRAAGLLAAALALLSPGVAALPLCDSREQREAFFKSMKPWEKALEEKRYADLDRHYNTLIADTAAGRLTDQELNRWFQNFNWWNPGREPLHEDWIRAYPNSAAAHLASAYYYYARGWNSRGGEFASKTSESQFQAMGLEFRKAFQALTRVEALMPRPTLAASKRIAMMVASSDPNDRARDIYASAIKTFPETVQVRVEWLAKSQPKWGGSIRQLEAIITDAKSLSKDNQRYIEYLVHEEIGSAYQLNEDYKRAADAYRKAVPLCPGLDNALTRLINMLKDRKDFEALVPAVDLYIERYPRSGWAYAMRGWTYVERKDWPPAVRDYEKAASLGYSDGYEGLAWLVEWGYGVKHDYRRAIDLYETAAANGSKTAAQKADNIRKAAGIQMR